MTRCGCSSPGVLGCTCVLIDSDCIEVTGAGTAASPYGLAPVIDPDADNLMVCGSGLLADFSDAGPQCNAGDSGNFTLNNSSETAASFTSESFDTDGMHSNVTNPSRITAQTKGVYLVTVWTSFFIGDPDGVRRSRIRKNGTDFVIERGTPGEWTSVHSLLVVVRLDVAEYVEVVMFQDSGASGTVSAEDFRATYLGAY